MGSVSQLLAKHSVLVRRGRVDIHRDQGIVERFNRTLAFLGFTSGASCGGRSSFRFYPGREFMGSVSQLLAKHSVLVRRGQVDIHRDQGIVERFNRTLAERSTEWVKRLLSFVAIKAKTLTQKPCSVVPGSLLGLKEQKVPSGVGVRYLYQPGELEGGRMRATDPVWSLEVYRLGRSVTEPDEPVLYLLQGDDASQRGFVREELFALPSDTQLPRDGVRRR